MVVAKDVTGEEEEKSIFTRNQGPSTFGPELPEKAPLREKAEVIRKEVATEMLNAQAQAEQETGAAASGAVKTLSGLAAGIASFFLPALTPVFAAGAYGIGKATDAISSEAVKGSKASEYATDVGASPEVQAAEAAAAQQEEDIEKAKEMRTVQSAQRMGKTLSPGGSPFSGPTLGSFGVKRIG